MNDLGPFHNPGIGAAPSQGKPNYVLTAIVLAGSILSAMTCEAPDPAEAAPDCLEETEATDGNMPSEAKPRSVRLMIIGHVKKPGPYSVIVPVSVDRLLDLAGGPSEQAATNIIQVYQEMRDLDPSDRRRWPALASDSESMQVATIMQWDQFKELSQRLVDFNAIRILSADELDHRWQRLLHPSP